MSDTAQLAQLLRDAAQAHHEAFAALNGDDPEWPAWYARWVLPRLEGMLAVGERDLGAALAGLDREQRERAPGRPWAEYYAQRLVERYSSRPRD